MEEPIRLEMTKAEAEQLQAVLADWSEKMRQANERMAQDEAEIARLKAETRAMLNQVKATLKMERLPITKIS